MRRILVALVVGVFSVTANAALVNLYPADEATSCCVGFTGVWELRIEVTEAVLVEEFGMAFRVLASTKKFDYAILSGDRSQTLFSATGQFAPTGGRYTPRDILVDMVLGPGEYWLKVDAQPSGENEVVPYLSRPFLRNYLPYATPDGLIIVRGYAHGCCGAQMGLFSITATPIPIPAAAWLFGSALGLLGYLKRRT